MYIHILYHVMLYSVLIVILSISTYHLTRRQDGPGSRLSVGRGQARTAPGLRGVHISPSRRFRLFTNVDTERSLVTARTRILPSQAGVAERGRKSGERHN